MRNLTLVSRPCGVGNGERQRMALSNDKSSFRAAKFTVITNLLGRPSTAPFDMLPIGYSDPKDVARPLSDTSTTDSRETDSASTDSSTTDGNTTDSGATDGGTTDSGSLDAAASDPGIVRCSRQRCSVPDQQCCVTNAGQTCDPSGNACAGVAVHCDEAADCTNAKVCCVRSSAAGATVTCESSCPATPTQYQVGKTNAECQNGLDCKVQNCGGVIVSSCGSLPGCSPQ